MIFFHCRLAQLDVANVDEWFVVEKLYVFVQFRQYWQICLEKFPFRIMQRNRSKEFKQTDTQFSLPLIICSLSLSNEERWEQEAGNAFSTIRFYWLLLLYLWKIRVFQNRLSLTNTQTHITQIHLFGQRFCQTKEKKPTPGWSVIVKINNWIKFK